MSALSCGNCRQTLSGRTARCPSCGVLQDRPAAPIATRAGARSASPLGPEFAGKPAAVGARLASLTIDVVAVALAAVAVAVLTRSVVLTALAVVELAVGLLVVQARTGLGLGNALLRLRVSRSDAPFSPGLGRAFVRSFLTGAGSLALGVGAWGVEASSAWDRGARRRSWADRAAGTVVVAVPRRVASEPAASAAPPIVVPPLPGGVLFDFSGHATMLPGAAPAVAPALSAALLVIVDTGQRERLPFPVSVNLGRAPGASEPGDRLLVVRDPEHTVSKMHARLEHSLSGTWITDGGSTNGTELLDETGASRRLEPGVRTRVEDGVRVQLGNRVLTISRLLGGAS